MTLGARATGSVTGIISTHDLYHTLRTERNAEQDVSYCSQNNACKLYQSGAVWVSNSVCWKSFVEVLSVFVRIPGSGSCTMSLVLCEHSATLLGVWQQQGQSRQLPCLLLWKGCPVLWLLILLWKWELLLPKQLSSFKEQPGSLLVGCALSDKGGCCFRHVTGKIKGFKKDQNFQLFPQPFCSGNSTQYIALWEDSLDEIMSWMKSMHTAQLNVDTNLLLGCRGQLCWVPAICAVRSLKSRESCRGSATWCMLYLVGLSLCHQMVTFCCEWAWWGENAILHNHLQNCLTEEHVCTKEGTETER